MKKTNYLRKIRKAVQKAQDAKRFEHTLGVEYTAAALAMRYGSDIDSARAAGLLHDCAKCLSDEKRLSICRKNHIPVTEVERKNPFLLHAKAGAYLAREKYGIKDPEHHQGGQQAGPYASLILKEVLPYLGVTSDSNNEENIEEAENKQIAVINVKDMTISEAYSKLFSLGFNVVYNTQEDPNAVLVADQIPKAGIALSENSVICLYTSSETDRKKVQVPNVKGMTAEQAANSLRSQNLNISVDGTNGIVITQEPTFETEVEEGTVINVVIKEELKDGQ